jgi:hypothetical protein
VQFVGNPLTVRVDLIDYPAIIIPKGETMLEIIKSKLQIIDNKVRFAISQVSRLKPNEVRYFVDIVSKKNEIETFCVEKDEWIMFQDMDDEKQKAIKKLKAKEKREKQALQLKKLQEKA